MAEEQRLWFCTWGTMVGLVWATCPQNAEQRVRHQCFNRNLPLAEVVRRPLAVAGEVKVLREATTRDREVVAEWTGKEPA